MNHPTFKLLLIVAGLVYAVQSSYADPPEPILPKTPQAKPEQYGNHIEQKCGIKLYGGWNYEGTCEFPISVDQCEDGLSVRNRSRARRPCPIEWNSQPDRGEEDDEDEPEPEPRRYLCCIRQACGHNLVGRCQNGYKRCPGTWLLGALDGTPIENKCPIEDETLVACCEPQESSSKAEDSTTKSSSLLPSLCSATNEQACGLRDESQIPVSLDSQQSLSAASFDAGIQIGHDSIQAFPGDFPVTIAQMTTDSLQHDGWDSLPPLANSAPIGRGPYLQGSPHAQALAAAAPNSNIETNNDVTDWRITT